MQSIAEEEAHKQENVGNVLGTTKTRPQSYIAKVQNQVNQSPHKSDAPEYLMSRTARDNGS